MWKTCCECFQSPKITLESESAFEKILRPREQVETLKKLILPWNSLAKSYAAQRVFTSAYVADALKVHGEQGNRNLYRKWLSDNGNRSKYWWSRLGPPLKKLDLKKFVWTYKKNFKSKMTQIYHSDFSCSSLSFRVRNMLWMLSKSETGWGIGISAQNYYAATATGRSNIKVNVFSLKKCESEEQLQRREFSCGNHLVNAYKVQKWMGNPNL